MTPARRHGLTAALAALAWGVATPPSARGQTGLPPTRPSLSPSGPSPAASDASPAASTPSHLALARALIESLEPSRTAYRHRSWVRFAHDGEPAIAMTDCSGLLNALLESTHPRALRAVLASSARGRPQAIDYVAAIRRGEGFEPIVRVDDLRPGDLIAIAYPPGTADTGHVMLVDAAPVPADGPPVADGLTAWRIEVIDATATPHGSDDSRAGPPLRTGVGRGAVRLYAEAGGEPGGYTWSTRARSPLHRATARPLALGRPI
jgi:hypothetical protein